MRTPTTTGDHPDPFSEVSVKPGPKVIETSGPEAQSLFALIGAQPFFKGLNPRHQQLLADQALEMRFETGQELLQEGSPANRFFLILEGQVVLESEVAERGLFLIQTLEPGDELGWSWLFPPYLFNATARALSPTRTIFFYATRLREHCDQDHELGFQLMQRVAEVLSQRLQATQQRLLKCLATDNRPNLPAS